MPAPDVVTDGPVADQQHARGVVGEGGSRTAPSSVRSAARTVDAGAGQREVVGTITPSPYAGARRHAATHGSGCTTASRARAARPDESGETRRAARRDLGAPRLSWARGSLPPRPRRTGNRRRAGPRRVRRPATRSARHRLRHRRRHRLARAALGRARPAARRRRCRARGRGRPARHARPRRPSAARLPFAVPAPVGFAHLPEGGRATVHAEIPGRRRCDLEHLQPGPGPRRLARPRDRRAARAADEHRRERRPARVRRGRVPRSVDRPRSTRPRAPARSRPTLLRRWEERLEDVALWRFRPTVVHGDLTSERVLVARRRRDRDPALGRRLRGRPRRRPRVAARRGSARTPPTRSWRRTSCAAPSSSTRTWSTARCSPVSSRWPGGCSTACGRSDAEIIDDAVAMLEDLDDAHAATTSAEAERQMA